MVQSGQIYCLRIDLICCWLRLLFRTYQGRRGAVSSGTASPAGAAIAEAGLPPGLLTPEAHLTEHVSRGDQRVGLTVFATHRAAFEELAAGVFTS